MTRLDTLVLAALIVVGLVAVVVLALAGHAVPDQLWAALTTLVGGLVGRMFPSPPADSAAGGSSSGASQ